MSRADARVLVVGLGGLGCPMALGLVAGGARHLTLVDDDTVSVENLHRQILYRTADVGRPKVEVAREVLLARAPDASINVLRRRLDPAGMVEAVRAHDVVLDGTDHPVTKFLLNDACARAGVPLVHAGAVRWGGQLLAVLPGAPCLRCLFEEPPATDGELCGEAGVVGPAVGLVGALGADLALAILDGERAGGELLTVDGLTGSSRRVRFARRPGCTGCCDLRAPLATPPLTTDGVRPC